MFLNQQTMLKEFEAAMATLDQPVEAYLAQLNAIQVHDTRSRLGSITIPTLVLAGAEDILIPMNLARELHSLVPGAQFATAKGGHAFLWEFPAPFNEAVLKFVGGHRGSAPPSRKSAQPQRR
jgi:3-oxoadipate enol-lactonase